MSVANPSNISGEIARILAARNLIRTKLNSMDLASVTDNITTLASTIDAIPNQGTISASVNVGESYTIPRGYHSGSGTVSGAQGSGQFLLQTPDPVTPTKTLQNITPDNGYYGLASVKVKPIPDAYQDVSSVTAQASQVLATKIFVDAAGNIVTGTMTNNGAVNQTISVASPSYTIPSGYHSGSGKVSLVTETKSVTPSAASQDIIPTNGKVLSKVTVGAIPAPYYDVSGVTAVASQVLAGTSYITSSGSLIAGTMVDNGAVSSTLTASSTQYNIPSGYHNGSGVINIVTETKAATPSTVSQNITPTTGKVLSSVTVNAIPSAYQDVTQVTATASDVIASKKFVSSTGDVITGTMIDRGTISTQTLSTVTTSYTVPSGRHSGSGKVQIVLEEKNATPSSAAQNIVPTSGKVLSKVTVAAIPAPYYDVSGVTAAASQVLAGTSYVTSAGALTAGTMTNRGAVSKTLDATSGNQSYTVPQGYHNGTGAVSIVLETKSATPATTSQDIIPTSGKVLSKVSVAAIPSKYGDTSTDTAVASNILTGIKAHTISGGAAVQITGTMPNNGAISGSFDGLTVTSYTVPSGYHNGSGTVSLTDDIEIALASI